MARPGDALVSAKKKKSGFLGGLEKGGLHRALGVPEGQKIPQSKIAAAAKSSNPNLRKKAAFAKSAAKWGS